MTIRNVQKQDIPTIAKLYSQSLSPLITSTYLSNLLSEPQTIDQDIKRLFPHLFGYVAIEQDEVVGWFIYFKPNCPFFSRAMGIYSPDWGLGAVGSQRIRIIEALYSHASRDWMDEDRYTHTLSVNPCDHELLDTLFALGFGQQVIDAIRDLSPIPGNETITIKKAGIEDEPILMTMSKKTDQHLESSPCFLYRGEDDEDEDEHEPWMVDPDNVAFIAYMDQKPVGAIKAHSPARDLSYLVQLLGDDTLAVCSMQVDSTCRGQGIAAALLNAMVDYAKAIGKMRLSVDFETANIAGRRFWLRHFKPVRICVVRKLDDRWQDR